MPLKYLHAYAPIGDLSPLRGMDLEFLAVGGAAITDLEPLRGMECDELKLDGCHNLKSIEPVQGMPCTKFHLYHCDKIESIEPLRGMPCVYLNLYRTVELKSLEPLRGMPLQVLKMTLCGATDLTPLAGLPLVEIEFDLHRIKSGVEVLRGIKTLTRIRPSTATFSATEFWKRYDAGEFKTTR